MDECTVIIPICGDLDYWRPLAARAAASVRAQTVVVPHLVVEAATVAAARNQGAEQADSTHLVYLDADDELEPRYIEAMVAAIGSPGPALYQPATLGVVNGVPDATPVLIPPKDSLLDGNWMVIGTMVERDQLLRVGGFDPSLEAVEDWDLWLRCWSDGATFVQVPEAIYRVHVRPGSRNDVDRASAVRLFNEVRNRYDHAR